MFSWTSRRRLVQDTIVVLVTVFLFAVFLLVVDQTWGWLLTRETLFGGIVPKPKAAQVTFSQRIPAGQVAISVLTTAS